MRGGPDWASRAPYSSTTSPVTMIGAIERHRHMIDSWLIIIGIFMSIIWQTNSKTDTNKSEGASSPGTVSTIKGSWSDVKVTVGNNHALEIPMLIFEIFFRDHPSTIKYFKRFGSDATTIMKNDVFKRHARENVFDTFDRIVSVIDKPDEVRQISEWLGEVHRPRNITNEHFQNLGDSIVNALKQVLGERFTKEVEVAWRNVIVALMSSIAASSSK